MKKIRTAFICILCLVAIILSSATAYAQSTEYYLEELGLSIFLSDTLNVKTSQNSALPQGYYLEAVDEDNSLRFSIAMEKNEATKQVDSFSNQSSSYLENYKSSLEDKGLSEVKEATYGSVLFLDYKQTTRNSDNSETFELHSITCINGMSIAIVSESFADNFTSDELALIKGALESIRFDSVQIQKKEEAKKTAKGWIIGILAILAVVAATVFAVIYIKKLKRRKAAISGQKKNTDYDVLRGAENPSPKARQKNLGGYKTSSDYFDEHFDNDVPQKSESTVSSKPTEKKKASFSTRMSYFAKNLTKEINKSKNQKSKNKKQKAKKKRKTEDYDIFSTK